MWLRHISRLWSQLKQYQKSKSSNLNDKNCSCVVVFHQLKQDSSDVSNTCMQTFLAEELNILFPHSLRLGQEELEAMNLGKTDSMKEHWQCQLPQQHSCSLGENQNKTLWVVAELTVPSLQIRLLLNLLPSQHYTYGSTVGSLFSFFINTFNLLKKIFFQYSWSCETNYENLLPMTGAVKVQETYLKHSSCTLTQQLPSFLSCMHTEGPARHTSS